jgi:hypothetical protein
MHVGMSRVVEGLVLGGVRDARQIARPEGTHGQPPAIAGSSRTSSRSPTGVASPSR